MLIMVSGPTSDESEEVRAERCDAVLLIGESGGACREATVFERAGRPVYRSVEEVPRGAAAAT